ncbi:MAG: hypothetical protein HYU64_05850 [Armatimonadetes bacterium]|nr:hypothetical protein [Armatimonadota bacterium]
MLRALSAAALGTLASAFVTPWRIRIAMMEESQGLQQVVQYDDIQSGDLFEANVIWQHRLSEVRQVETIILSGLQGKPQRQRTLEEMDAKLLKLSVRRWCQKN